MQRRIVEHLRPAALAVGLIGAIVLTTALLIASPPGIRALADSRSDWDRLSAVGQTYEGIAAILAGLAFCGVAVSLLLQWRQNRLTQVIAMAERQHELQRLALDNPQLSHLGMPSDRDPDTDVRPWIYCHMLVWHWRLSWEIGQLSDRRLEHHARDLFSAPEAQDWWVVVRDRWANNDSRRSRRFVALVNSGCQRAVAANNTRSDEPPATSPPDGTRLPSKSS